MGLPTLLSLALAVALTSCSKKLSSDAPSEDQGNGFFPTLNFSVGSNITEQPQTKPNSEMETRGNAFGSNILSHWGRRTNRTVEFIDHYLKFLNKAYLPSDYTEGTHQLANGNAIFVKVADLADDGEFTRQAILCHENNPFLYLKWSTDKNKFRAYRDFSINPHQMDPNLNKTMLTEIDYVKNPENNDTSLVFSVNGAPWEKPNDVNDGDYLAERIEATKKNDGSITLSGVNAWLSSAIDNSFTGDGKGDVWMVGQLNTDGSGKFVAHRRYNVLICNSAFNEANPNWCFGANINPAGSPNFIISGLDTLWASLQSISLTNDSGLKHVSMPTTLDCTPQSQ